MSFRAPRNLTHCLKSIVITVILLLCCSIDAFSYNSASEIVWELHSEDNNISIFLAKEKHKSGLLPMRAKMILNYDMEKVITVVADNTRKREWVPSLIENYTIEHLGDYRRIDFARYDSPWPFDDRYFVLDLKAKYNYKKEAFEFIFSSTKHPRAPKNKKWVEGATYFGSVIIREHGKGKTFLDMTMITDFKGSIPTWLINFIQRRWPHKTLRNLNRQLAKDDIVLLPQFSTKEFFKKSKRGK